MFPANSASRKEKKDNGGVKYYSQEFASAIGSYPVNVIDMIRVTGVLNKNAFLGTRTRI